MRVVIQRVTNASVVVDEMVTGSIGLGFLILLGIEEADTAADAEWLAQKIVGMRIFPDAEGKMNRDIREADGDMLVVSQFTLYASTKKGNRPSFIRAAKPEVAIPLYEYFILTLHQLSGKKIESGRFGAHMEVKLLNDGPVTILMDTHQKE